MLLKEFGGALVFLYTQAGPLQSFTSCCLVIAAVVCKRNGNELFVHLSWISQSQQYSHFGLDNFLLWGLSCAYKNVYQHPCTFPTRWQQHHHPPYVTAKNVSCEAVSFLTENLLQNVVSYCVSPFNHLHLTSSFVQLLSQLFI